MNSKLLLYYQRNGWQSLILYTRNCLFESKEDLEMNISGKIEKSATYQYTIYFLKSVTRPEGFKIERQART